MGVEDIYTLDETTEVRFEGTKLSEEEWEWLQNVTSGAAVSGQQDSEERHVDRVTLKTEELAQMAFEYDILRDVANTVEIEVIRYFRESEETTHTTSEISDELDRAKSSISRALGRLTEKGQIERVQQGVYRNRLR